jgi:hypothetical protein
LKLEVVDDAFQLWAPRSNVSRDRLQLGHPGITIVVGERGGDRLDRGEALGDVRRLVGMRELQRREASRDA